MGFCHCHVDAQMVGRPRQRLHLVGAERLTMHEGRRQRRQLNKTPNSARQRLQVVWRARHVRPSAVQASPTSYARQSRHLRSSALHVNYGEGGLHIKTGCEAEGRSQGAGDGTGTFRRRKPDSGARQTVAVGTVPARASAWRVVRALVDEGANVVAGEANGRRPGRTSQG